MRRLLNEAPADPESAWCLALNCLQAWRHCTLDNTLLIGMGETKVGLQLAYANRHGLIAGATGTGKTVTLQGLAEGFSAAGVPGRAEYLNE